MRELVNVLKPKVSERSESNQTGMNQQKQDYQAVNAT